jgi:hypothetical protein
LLVERFLKLKEKLSREVEAQQIRDGLFFQKLLDLFLAHVQANRDEGRLASIGSSSVATKNSW